MTDYLDRLVDERDSLSMQLEAVTDKLNTERAMSRRLFELVASATPEQLTKMPIKGYSSWRNKGFSRTQAKVMALLDQVLFEAGRGEGK